MSQYVSVGSRVGKVQPGGFTLEQERAEQLYKECIQKGHFIKDLKQDTISLPSQEFFICSIYPAKNPKEEKYLGFFKMRGAFASAEAAEEHAKRLIREEDSTSNYMIGRVGALTPLTSDIQACQDILDVPEGKDTRSLRDEKAKQEDAKMQEDLKIAMKNCEKNKFKEEDEIERALEKRVSELTAGAAGQETEDALDIYVTKRVTEHRLTLEIQQLKEKLVEITKKRDMVWDALVDFEKDNGADLNDKWMERYNRELVSRKIRPVEPKEDDYAEYEAFRKSRQ